METSKWMCIAGCNAAKCEPTRDGRSILRVQCALVQYRDVKCSAMRAGAMRGATQDAMRDILRCNATQCAKQSAGSEFRVYSKNARRDARCTIQCACKERCNARCHARHSCASVRCNPRACAAQNAKRDAMRGAMRKPAYMAACSMQYTYMHELSV